MLSTKFKRIIRIKTFHTQILVIDINYYIYVNIFGDITQNILSYFSKY